MAAYFPAFWAVGVSLSQALEKTRDPWLVTSAAFLILLALTYLASARARYAIDASLQETGRLIVVGRDDH